MGDLNFQAVIFDLDGVITKTALVHGAAWKGVFDEYLRYREEKYGEKFVEFTHENDYLPYVDGKPRYEGVKSFLESRGVDIPYGETEDAPENETICGIGNRKNIKFLEILETEGAQLYGSTVKLIKDLKNNGVRIGVASSSKNCKFVLKSAGIEDLFETRVDGEVSARIGLKGKPEGDIFVTAAADLGASPASSVVVEDATSGVQAGRNGAFGLVIGIARENNEDELQSNGADVVVSDMEHIDVAWIKRWFDRRPRGLFECWDTQPEGELERTGLDAGDANISLNPVFHNCAKKLLLGKKRPVFFFDYDGTLTPIVEKPELAVISDEMRDIVKRVSGKYMTAIVSGRARGDVENLLGIKGLIYAGNHGFDIKGPDISMIYPPAAESVSVIKEVTARLSGELASIPGLLIEKKDFSLAVHYRLVDEKKIPGIEKRVTEETGASDRLRLMKGKKVFEILPAIDWDKGKAVRWIMEVLDLSWGGTSVVYIGDDTTDEDAFRMVRTRGTGILVSDKDKYSSADFCLRTPDDVKAFLGKILAG